MDDYFVEPHQSTMPFAEMLSWLLSRKAGVRTSPIRYVQSQNGNLSGEFESLKADVSELEWANECIGRDVPKDILMRIQGHRQMLAISGLVMRKV